MTDFAGLGVAETILRALRDEGYTNPTPIQARAIPTLLEGRDLLGIAQTGTGKTCAFAVPIIQRLVANHRRAAPGTTRALILAPTRELAVQIGDSFRAYGRHARINVAVVVGGVGMGPQIQAISRGLDVLVATPGRLLDHMESRRLRLDATEVVVLDEADHMLDLGFIVPIRRIVSKLPRARQTLFFSATMPQEIAKLAGEMLHNPAR
ncbi:MAG: DEAD/DEAH box helicase, partial [Hyphomicrobiales bacterium]|nr:DEAD/DEAH box helicase [Hyphomicrobiales bacterium]